MKLPLSMRQPWRLWHTVRFLKFKQILGRLPRWHRPLRSVESLPVRSLSPVSFPPCHRATGWLSESQISILGTPYSPFEEGWEGVRLTALQRYHLHYFEDLQSVGWETRQGLYERWIFSWIEHHRPGKNQVGWAPYPLSRRVPAWIRWILSCGETLDPGLRQRMLQSLVQQLLWLEDRLEVHLLGNHLLANYKALVFGGCFFRSSHSERWLNVGWKGLLAELQEQVLGDGGHFERSPMYHNLIFEDVLEIKALAQSVGLSLPEGLSERMLRFSSLMVHPDGALPCFNDTAQQESRLSLVSRDTEVRRQTWLKNSGFLSWVLGPVHFFADVGSPGPSYIPGHAHAGTFGFELSLKGRRMFVQRGISTYDSNAQRLEERHSSSHNTSNRCAISSSDVWKSFRLGRRAQVHEARMWVTEDGAYGWTGRHNGYRTLFSQKWVTRTFLLTLSSLSCTDEWEGLGKGEWGEVYFYLHPQITELSQQGDFCAVWTLGEEKVQFESSQALSLQPVWMYPTFYKQVLTHRILIKAERSPLRTHCEW